MLSLVSLKYFWIHCIFSPTRRNLNKNILTNPAWHIFNWRSKIGGLHNITCQNPNLLKKSQFPCFHSFKIKYPKHKFVKGITILLMLLTGTEAFMLKNYYVMLINKNMKSVFWNLKSVQFRTATTITTTTWIGYE